MGGHTVKRTPMPRSTTALCRYASLTARTGLAQVVPLRRRIPAPVTPLRPRIQMHPLVRQLVFERADGLCDSCGQPVPAKGWHFHHRKLRAQGGRDDAANGLCLHETCHFVIHREPAWAYERGLLVRQRQDPSVVPVLLHGQVRVLPVVGGWAPINPDDGNAA